MSASLSSEQEAFLEECMVEFSERFSDADLEYKKIYDLGIPKPPIMCPWSTRGRFNNRNDGRYNREDRPYHRDDRQYNRGDGQYNNRDGGRYSRDRRDYAGDQGNNSHNNRSDRSYHPYKRQESGKRPRPY